MIYVDNSEIEGKGLFAKKRIKLGTVIGTVDGRSVSEDGPHVLWLDDGTGFLVENDMKYINHSADPNCAYFDDLTVVALRDIEAGEELTHHYGADWE